MHHAFRWTFALSNVVLLAIKCERRADGEQAAQKLNELATLAARSEQSQLA